MAMSVGSVIHAVLGDDSSPDDSHNPSEASFADESSLETSTAPECGRDDADSTRTGDSSSDAVASSGSGRKKSKKESSWLSL